MLALTPLTNFLGISSLVLLAIGYTYCVLFLIKYIYVKKILVPVVALVAFCCGSFYLGPSVSYISLLATGENISSNLYYILSYVMLPVGTMGIVFMALNVFYPKLQRAANIVYGIITVVYYVFMFGFTSQQHTSEISAGTELLDISHAGVSLIVTAIALLSVLLIDSLGFFLLSRKLNLKGYSSRDVRKAFMIGLGWLLFFISGVVDAMVPPLNIAFVAVVRGLMLIAFNLIYLGFWSKPTRIE